MTTADRFREFAADANRAGSSRYAEWARGVAVSPDLVAIIDRARPSQRQPVLVFAVARLLGAEVGPFVGFGEWIRGRADDLVTELDRRHTQTNDVRRVGPVAVGLRRILRSDSTPVALLEVGASAGLGLFPDRYDVRVGGRSVGDPSSRVRVSVTLDRDQDAIGRDAPPPRVAFRAGLDLAPLDASSAADRLWLETLLWPGQDDRVALLRDALDIVRREPPRLIEGDAVDRLGDLVALAPPGVVPVVVTTGTLVYLAGERRQAFVDRIAELGVRWISYERSGLLTEIHATVPDPDASPGWFATLAVDGRAIALGNAHGTRLSLLQ